MINKVKTLAKNDTFMKYVKNSSWMMAEYALRIVSAIFVSIYVARYLGPEKYGTLSYVLAIVAILMTIGRLGMESVLVRDLSKRPEQPKAYMGTAFGLMVITAIVGYSILSTLIYFFENDPKIKLYVWVIAGGIFFQTFLVVDYGFQAQLQAKYSSIAKSLALAIMAGVKIFLVLEKAELLFFAIAYAVDQLVIAIMLLIIHFIKRQSGFIFGFDKRLIKPLLVSAWPMVLSGVATILYIRIDQVMIKSMLDTHQLGLYVAATKIYEGWIIIPYVISISLLPAIVKLKSASPEKYEIYLTRLFAMMIWASIIVASVASFIGKWVVQKTYGETFAGSSTALSIIMWAAVFTALGTMTTRYLIAESMEKHIAFRTFVSVIINVCLNFMLIPRYGIDGSAMATLSTLIITNYFINYAHKDLRQLRRICNNALILNVFKIQGFQTLLITKNIKD